MFSGSFMLKIEQKKLSSKKEIAFHFPYLNIKATKIFSALWMCIRNVYIPAWDDHDAKYFAGCGNWCIKLYQN